MSDAVESWEEAADTRLNAMQVPKRHGVLISEVPVLGPRMVRVKGRTQHSSFENLRATIDTMQRILNSGRQKLHLWSDRYLYAYKSSFGFGYVPGTGLVAMDFSIDFLCDDPFWYDLEGESISEVLDASDVSLGGGQYQSDISLSNDGTVFNYPVITVTADQGSVLTQVRIQNLTTGKEFLYDGSVALGNSLIVDCSRFTVQNNGAEDLTNWNGVFLDLVRGSNSIRISGQPATYNFQWVNRYY